MVLSNETVQQWYIQCINRAEAGVDELRKVCHSRREHEGHDCPSCPCHLPALLSPERLGVREILSPSGSRRAGVRYLLSDGPGAVVGHAKHEGTLLDDVGFAVSIRHSRQSGRSAIIEACCIDPRKLGPLERWFLPTFSRSSHTLYCRAAYTEDRAGPAPQHFTAELYRRC
jgi:hypothetical protein